MYTLNICAFACVSASACLSVSVSELVSELVSVPVSVCVCESVYVRGGGLGSRPIFKKFHESYAPS